MAKDSSLYNNHGTIYGATWTDGKFGKALSFDGSDDYVDLGDILDMGSSDFTISAWIETTNSSGSVVCKYWGVNYQRSYWFYVTSDKLKFVSSKDGVSASNVEGNTVVTDGKWHHVAVVKEGTTATLYLDGSPDGSGAAYSSLYNNPNPLVIGIAKKTDGTLGTPFNGLIDEVRIYKRALSEGEIQMLYYNRIGAVPSKVI